MSHGTRPSLASLTTALRIHWYVPCSACAMFVQAHCWLVDCCLSTGWLPHTSTLCLGTCHISMCPLLVGWSFVKCFPTLQGMLCIHAHSGLGLACMPQCVPWLHIPVIGWLDRCHMYALVGTIFSHAIPNCYCYMPSCMH